MLLPVMRNGTFCTTTIVKKSAGKIQAWAEHTSVTDVTSGHVTSCPMASLPVTHAQWPDSAWRVAIPLKCGLNRPHILLTIEQPCYPILTDVLVGHINSDKFRVIEIFISFLSFLIQSQFGSLPQSISILSNLEFFKSGISTLTFEGFPTHL